MRKQKNVYQDFLNDLTGDLKKISDYLMGFTDQDRDNLQLSTLLENNQKRYHAIFIDLLEDFLPPINREDIGQIYLLLLGILKEMINLLNLIPEWEEQRSDIKEFFKLYDECTSSLQTVIPLLLERKLYKKLISSLNVFDDYEKKTQILYQRGFHSLLKDSVDPIYLWKHELLLKRCMQISDRMINCANLSQFIILKNS